jgi:hypothetical protein
MDIVRDNVVSTALSTWWSPSRHVEERIPWLLNALLRATPIDPLPAAADASPGRRSPRSLPWR